jgi:glycosyltransferase involved in cell wall biosynthesis/GT2 family glycosyltransferase
MPEHSVGEVAPPPVSVVVCSAGRRASLTRTLDALHGQTYRPLEVIVVVGPGADGTGEYLAALPDVKVRHVDSLVLSRARNEGIRAAAGEVVAFVDDDALPEPRWIEEMVRVLQKEGADCGGVGGAVVNESARSRPLQFRHGLVSERGDIDDVRLEPGTAHAPDGYWFNRVMGTNMAFRREALRAIGGFDETFAYGHDETDVCVRLIRAGFRVAHHGRAYVHHFPGLGPHRRSRYEVNWFALVRSETYFALKHTRRGRGPALRAALAHYAHHLGNFWQWFRLGEISLWALLRYSGAGFRGLCSGLRRGWSKGSGAPGLSATPPPFLTLASAPNPEVRTPRTGPPHRGSRLRVALVYGFFGTEPGGITAYTLHLAEALTALGHAVVVVRAGGSPCLVRPRGCRVLEVPAERIRAVSFPIALYETLRDLSLEWPLDLVEAPLWRGEAAGLGIANAWPLVVRLETPTSVLRTFSAVPEAPEHLAAVAAERLQLSYAAGAIAISRAVRETVETVHELNLHTHARRAAVIPLGLPDMAAPARKRVEAADLGGPRFLYVGRLEARKGTPELGEAFSRVARRLPRASLWIAGRDNSDGDGSRGRTGLSYVERLRARWGPEIAGRVHFFGPVSEAEKLDLYARCDVFVAPSRYESFGLIYLEAMRQGKPVVGTRAGGIQEVVEDGRTGLLVPPESPEDLAEAMTRLGDDAALRHEFGAASRARFEEEFTLSRCARRTDQFYREVLATWEGRGVAHRPTSA